MTTPLLTPDTTAGPDLPVPTSRRMVLLRVGLAGIWEYPHDTRLRPEGGWMHLRGTNESGKSKAIEVTLPAVLDARFTARRLSPVAAESRTMRDNLIGPHTRSESPTAYVFCEFGMVDDHDNPVYFTCGYGVKASKSGKGHSVWPFILEQSRIDQDVELFPGNVPLSESALADAIGDHGRVFGRSSTNDEYRDAVNRRLFGLSSGQYDSLMDLLIKLRRPHLGAKVKIEDLNAELSTSLPTLELGLLRQVTESMDRIEQARQERDSLTQAAGHLRAYQASERRYLAAVVLEQAVELINAFNIEEHHRQALADRTAELHDVLPKVRRTPAAQRAAYENLPWLERWLDRHERSLDGIGQRLDATQAALIELRTSGDFTTVERIQMLNGQADDARRRLQRRSEAKQKATERLAEARRRSQQSQATLDTALDALMATATDVASAARQLGLTDVADACAQPTTLDDAIAAAEDQTLVIADDLTVLGALADEAARLRDHAAQLARVAEERHEAATTLRRDAADLRAAATASEQDWRDAVQQWLTTSPAELPHDLHVAVADADRADLETAARAALDRARLTVRSDLTTATLHRDALDTQHQALIAQRDELTSQDTVVPARPDWRTTSGTPLYRCVEPHASLSDSEQALLEGAMVAVGLADATVADSRVRLDDITIDPAAPIDGPSLADLLVVAPDSPGDPDVVAGVLAAISTDPDGNAPLMVAPDGRWRAGNLTGKRTGPAHPVLISQAARERARAQTLALLDERISGITTQIAATNETIGRLRSLADALAGHSLPSAEEAVRADASASTKEADVVRAHGLAIQADTAAEAAAAEIGPAREKLSAEAQRRGRAQWVGALGALADLRHDLVTALSALRSAQQHHQTRLLHHAGLAEQQQAVLSDLRDATADVEELDTEVRNLLSQIAARRGTLGASEQELIDRETRLKTALEHQKAARATVERRKTAVASMLGSVRTAVEEHQTRREEANADIDVWTGRLNDMHHARALSPAAVHLGVDLPDGPPDQWPRRLARDIGRALLAAVPNLPQAGDARRAELRKRLKSAQERINNDRDRLRERLRPRFDPHEHPVDERISVIRCFHDDIGYTVDGLVDLVDAEVAIAERRLTDEEKRIIEGFLTGELRRDLNTAMLAAEERVAQIQAAIAQVETNSGRRMRLRWVAAPDSPEVADVIEALRKEILTASQRETLVTFFRNRLESARLPHGETDERDDVQRLAEELDYRNWFRFVIQVCDPNLDLGTYVPDADGYVTLTTKVFGTGSGGSMSVLVHLPLFAAAASFYDSAASHAPRLVVLDEVLAGVDPGMTEEVLDLCGKFDFDLVTTGHDDWLAFPTVTHLAIYDVMRDKDAHVVDAERFTWNGTRLSGGHA